MEATKTEAPPKAQRNWRIAITLIGVALAIFMGALESTVVGTAMPTVIATLGGIEIYSWVFAAYILATTVMTPIWGKLADVVGRRPAFFLGAGRIPDWLGPLRVRRRRCLS
jgi:MFS family permease